MKVLFLHLSDAHFRETTKFSEINIKAMVQSLEQVRDFDECVMIFSGDVTQAGGHNEFKTAGSFVGYLLKQISEKYLDGKRIHTIIVPGNHDNLIQNTDRNNLELEEYYKSKQTSEKFYEELNQLENFYQFSDRNWCYHREKVIDVRKLEFGKFTIKFNLINSAPFSLLGSGNEDKGLHYIPNEEFSKLDMDCHENYTISVIHHGPEWFSDASKQKLYNKLYESTDLLFVGHEHFSLSENKKVNGRQIDVSSGVALHGTNTDHGFITLILDTEAHTLHGKRFIYNGRIYKPTPNLDNPNVIFHSKYKFTFKQQFQTEIMTDGNERAGKLYADYFIFPSLESKNINADLKNYTVTNEEKFVELFNMKPVISIEGSSRSGKSLLAKYLCNYFSQDYVSLFITDDNLSLRDSSKIIKYALQYQYGDDADLDEFIQLDKDKKILIVDGYDKVKREIWTTFYEKYKDMFGHIIMLCGIDWNLNLKKKAIEELTDNKIFYMRICPFYYIKREELIKKICTVHKEEHPALDIAEKSKKINEDITNQIKYFQLTPDFIHQFVDYYISFPHLNTQKETNVFNKVFESNITLRISKNTRMVSDVDEVMVALDFVAHYIHFNKRYPLPYEEFVEAIKEYKEKYDNEELKPKYVYDVAIKSNVMREVSGEFEIEFCDENLLAYFVAKHLNRTCNIGENPNDLKYVLDNICFGINGDIILFLSYITSDVQILMPIQQSIFEHMNDWEDMSLDTENISYLSKVTTQVNPKLPDGKAKEKLKEDKNEIEKQIVEEKRTEAESLYSYDETKVNSFSNKISKSINFLELVAKILPSFRYILTKEQKQSIVAMLYTYPNKLLYFMLKDIDSNYDKIIADILKLEPRTKKGLLITADMLGRELQSQTIAYILSIYDFISTTASTEKTITDLEKFDYESNTNYKLQNLLMQENIGNFKTFSTRAEELYDETKLGITKRMIKLIVRKYFLYHDVDLHGDTMHIVDKFFGKEERRNVQLIQAKNQIIKK